MPLFRRRKQNPITVKTIINFKIKPIIKTGIHHHQWSERVEPE